MTRARTGAVLILIVASALGVGAQGFDVEPVFDVELLADRTPMVAGETVKLAVVVTVDPGWHVNSDAPGDDFSMPTTVTWRVPDGWSEPVVSFPDGESISFEFSDQPIEVWEGRTVIFGAVEVPDVAAGTGGRIVVEVTAQACNNTQCLPPVPVRAGLDVSVAAAGTATTTANPELFQDVRDGGSAAAAAAPEGGGLDSRLASAGLPLQVVLVFLVGLGLAFTPCVYPMIPITISFFSQQAKERAGGTFPLAVVYVLGIAITYSTLGVVAALTGRLFGSALQSPWVVGLIVVILLALAASMFGLWELRMPGWAMNLAGGRQGLFGSLIMGLVVGIVAAPCVGPAVVGLLTYIGTTGDPVLGFVLFFALALGLGFPYLLLGTFTGMLQKMPMSGPWMIGVRKVFGVLLVALAAYFARPLLPDDVGDWLIAASLVLGGLYLLVWDRTGHEQAGVDRVMRLACAVMLGVGLLQVPSGHQVATAGEEMAWQAYDAAASRAIADGELVILDFYADWCAPCRELDEKTFSDPRVAGELARFARFKVDQTRPDEIAQELAEEYRVVGVPTVIVYRDGREAFRITGFEPPERFLERLQRVGG